MRLSTVYEKHFVQYQAHGKCCISISGHHYSYYQLPGSFLGSGGIRTEYKDRYNFPMDICQLPNILFLSACDILAIDKSLAPVTLVLAEDGTIVDDDDYFLCLPANTKFVVLAGNEKWTHNTGRKCWPYVQCTLHRDLLYCTRHLVALWLAVSTFMQQALLSTFCMPE